MTPLNIRLRRAVFDTVMRGETEIVKFASNKRIHYMCFSRMTRECNEPQSKCRECFENARTFDGYMCYPYDRAILRRGQSDRYVTREIANITWEERDGKIWFVVKLKDDGQQRDLPKEKRGRG